MLRLGHIPAIRRRLGDRDDRGVQTVTLFGPAVLSGVGRGDDLFSQASRRERCHTTAQVRSTHANILLAAAMSMRDGQCEQPAVGPVVGRVAATQYVWPTSSPRSCAFGPQAAPAHVHLAHKQPPLMCIWPTTSPRSCSLALTHVYLAANKQHLTSRHTVYVRPRAKNKSWSRQ
jgi:hypothetical protein